MKNKASEIKPARRRTITLAHAGRYDLGASKVIIMGVRIYGKGNPANAGKYFPPIRSPFGTLQLSGKFRLVASATDGTDTYLQYSAPGENSIHTTYIQCPVNEQQVLDEVITMQIDLIDL